MDRGIVPCGGPPRDPGNEASSSGGEPRAIARGDETQALAASDDRRLYCLLRDELVAAGCFRTSRLRAALLKIPVSGLAAAAYLGLLAAPHWPIRILLCALYGAAAVQGGFIGHEAGHLGMTRRPGRSAILGLFFMTILGGVSFAYFRERHRRHHQHTNVFASDPDVQCTGSSVCPESVSAKGPIGLWITANQGWLLWPWIFVVAIALKIEGCRFCLRRARYLLREQIALALHFAILIVAPAFFLGIWPALLNYAMWTIFAGPYLAAVFYPNHIGVEGLGAEATEPFLHRQLATTRNIAGGGLRSLLSGGLNHHIEHHLFPAMPAQRLTRASRITRSFCRRHGLGYREHSWRQGIAEVLGQIRRMGRMARELRRNIAMPAWQDPG